MQIRVVIALCSNLFLLKSLALGGLIAGLQGLVMGLLRVQRALKGRTAHKRENSASKKFYDAKRRLRFSLQRYRIK
jgi:hypothetical protein